MSTLNSENNNLGPLIADAKRQLEEDILRFRKSTENYDTEQRQSDDNHNLPLYNATLHGKELAKHVGLNGQKEVKVSPREKSSNCVKYSREEEINKLIEKISKPKEQQSIANYKQLHRSYPVVRCTNSLSCSPINIRELEKDQLSEKFALSESPLSKPSYRQIAKNLNSSISFTDSKQNNLTKVTDKGKIIYHSPQGYYDFTNAEDREEYLRAKYNHPRIVITQHKESSDDEDIGKENKMVRIGEFSPLNPNVPGGATVLGLGDWEERRQYLLQHYKQVSRSPSPSPCEGSHSHSHRSIAIQTELSEDWSPNISLEKGLPEKSHHHSWRQHDHGNSDGDKRCASPHIGPSPLTNCFENMTEKEIKEYLYRRELQKQIEEKNRLREEMKRKEAEEDARMEAKIQRDLEKMKLQDEEEKLQRLEQAIRKRELDEFLRERWAFEQQKTLQDNKIVRKQPFQNPGLQNWQLVQYEKGTQSDLERYNNNNGVRASYSRSLPERSAVAALSSVHKHLRQPLLQPSSDMSTSGYLLQDKPVKDTNPNRNTNLLLTNASKSPPISVRRSKEVDILAQKAVFDTSLKTSPCMSNLFPSDTVRDRVKEVDDFLKQPLLPEYERVLPPVSQPLIHATIPPLSVSLQNPSGASLNVTNRTNCDILEDKWKVPYVNHNAEAPQTKHNANARILTQLGTFRRQLQEESLRMRQRVKEDSP